MTTHKRETILRALRQKGGYAHTKDLLPHGVHVRELNKLVEEGIVTKIKPGLYRLTDLPQVGKGLDMLDVCMAFPKGVICLLSALSYFELTTFDPSEVHVAIPNRARRPKIHYPPVKVFFFPDRFYGAGIQVIETKAGRIRIYEKEKSICDIFRYRRKLGEDIALESLKNYVRARDKDLRKLMKFAKICGVEKVMSPILKGMIAE